MTQWGTAPPEGDQTPDTLADKAKKQPTSVLEFHLEQNRKKIEKAANNMTNLLWFFFIIDCSAMTYIISLALTQ